MSFVAWTEVLGNSVAVALPAKRAQPVVLTAERRMDSFDAGG